MRPRLLDAFCGADGAGMGYYQAGFEVIGVDHKPQKRYPFEFHLDDAIEFITEHGHEFDVIHASPPCQVYGKTKYLANDGHPDLIAKTRKILQQIGKLYIIENVPGSPLINPTLLNGALFCLLVHRPRLFETNFPLPLVLLPQNIPSIKMGQPIKDGDVIQPVGHFSGVSYARKEMEIDWMTRDELSQAIPPAYTKWLGERILEKLLIVNH